MKEIDIAIEGAYKTFAPFEQVVRVENLIIKDIEKRIRDGRSQCLECDISALTYHYTIKSVFDDILHGRWGTNDISDEVKKVLSEVLNNGENKSRNKSK